MTDDKSSSIEKWDALPNNEKLQILKSAYCSKCDLTTIVNYIIEENEFGIILKGKCKKCGKDILRLIEKES